MGIENAILNRFNYGLISRTALSRIDINRVGLGAEIQTNIIGKTLGAGMFRPGLKYTGATLNNAKARHIPFVYSIDDTAILEITDSVLRVKLSETVISRPSVTTTITNEEFTSDLAGWTQDDDTGALSYWSSGFMVLQGNGENAARRKQQVSVTGGNIGAEHAVRINVNRGPVILRIGSSDGADDYVPQITLDSSAGINGGLYSFAFTPSGDFWIQVENYETYADSLIESIELEASGEMQIAVPYAEDNLQYIRYTQIGDIVYIACDGIQPKKIVRYGTRSWGIEDYNPIDGPFGIINTSSIKLQPSGLNSQITLTSNIPYFRESMEGSLFKLTSNGQVVESVVAGDGQFSDYIKVVGVGAARKFSVTVTGTFSGTLQVQRSISEPGAWAASGLTSITAPGTSTYDDGDDNAIYYYRVGFIVGDYTSGSASVTLSIGSGSITGIVRALDYSSSTSMICSVLKPLGGTDFTDLWYKGAWSTQAGFPSAVEQHEGRLWWAGKDKIWGSISDAFESFDSDEEGDSGPISVSLGAGPVDRINWLMALLRLAVGTQTKEKVARSTSLDEPLTPTNFQLKNDSTRGSSPVDPVIIDQNGFFVRNNRLFQLNPSQRIDAAYQAEDMTIIVPEIGSSGFIRLAVQRYPDTRIHNLRNDGRVALFAFDEYEEVKAWQLIETDGVIEDVFTLPALEAGTEDMVYYCVKRTINGATKRYLEKWAKENECIGGTLNKQADSFIEWSGSSATITGLSHLEGEEVVVWADGKDYSSGYGDDQTTYTVASGQITLADTVTSAIVGLPYTGRYKSSKLAYGVDRASIGTPLTQTKIVTHVGLILIDTHNRGLRYGPSFDILDDLPLIENGVNVGADDIYTDYDEEGIEFDGDWDTDSRVCLEMQAPRPCTALGVVVGVETNDKV